MLGLVSVLWFVGYTLTYAAVANGGSLAEKPWEALRVDAYQVQQPSVGGAIEHAAKNAWHLIKTIGGFVLKWGPLP